MLPVEIIVIESPNDVNRLFSPDEKKPPFDGLFPCANTSHHSLPAQPFFLCCGENYTAGQFMSITTAAAAAIITAIIAAMRMAVTAAQIMRPVMAVAVMVRMAAGFML